MTSSEPTTQPTTAPTTTPRRRRTLRLAVAALVCGGTIAGAVAPAVASTQPIGGGGSSIDGMISRAEVLARAKYWYDHRGDSDMTYDNPGGTVLPFHWDVFQTRKYRRDCSGLVDNAWHLGSDPWTGNLATYATRLSSKSQLLPGDILLDAGYHVIIFKQWIGSGTSTFEYYAFGNTPMVDNTETLTGGSDGKIDSHPASAYVPYRYNNIF